MPTSTYVSLLVRSHLRTVTPLPTAELVVLKRSVAEVSAIGRNMNQIARAFNQGERASGPSNGGPLHATSGAQRPADSHQGTHQREPHQLADRL